jgi:hypothetical protein
VVFCHFFKNKKVAKIGRKVKRKIWARNKNLLHGVVGFGRAILADTPRIKLKEGSFAPDSTWMVMPLILFGITIHVEWLCR